MIAGATVDAELGDGDTEPATAPLLVPVVVATGTLPVVVATPPEASARGAAVATGTFA